MQHLVFLFLILIHKCNRPHFLSVYWRNNQVEMLGEHDKVCKSLGCGLWFYAILCVGDCTGKPIESAVYCIISGLNVYFHQYLSIGALLVSSFLFTERKYRITSAGMRCLIKESSVSRVSCKIIIFWSDLSLPRPPSHAFVNCFSMPWSSLILK